MIYLIIGCKVLLDNGESKDIINKALDDDALLVNIRLEIVPPALREAYGSDYECAKQFVAERGPFKVIQYDRDLSCTPEEAVSLRYRCYSESR